MSKDKDMALTEVDILANDLNQHCADLAENFCGETNCLTCLAHALIEQGWHKQIKAEWKWMHGCAGYGIYCTNCQTGWRESEQVELIAHSHDYCPKCGAKMKGGAE